MELDDKLAIQILKSGNLSGLESLVRKYQHNAIRTSMFITRDLGTAEDIVQSAFLKAADRIAQFDENKPFKPWFLRIVVNDSIKLAQNNARFFSYDNLENENDSPFLSNQSSFSESEGISQDTKQLVRDALFKLSTKERAVIVLQYFQEMSEKEIAETLNRPVGTVKWQLYSARKHLKDMLESSFAKNQIIANNSGIKETIGSSYER